MKTENLTVLKNKSQISNSKDNVDWKLVNKFERGLEDLKKGNFKRVK